MSDVTKEIRGTRYRLLRLPVRDAGRLAMQVGQLLAAALAGVEDLGALVKKLTAGEGVEALLSDQNLLSALAGGVANLDAVKLYDLALTAIEGRLFADRKLNTGDDVDAYFADKQGDLFLVLVWALQVNCAGFFGKGATVST